MRTHTIKKKKLKVVRTLLLMVILYIMGYLIYLILQLPIRNIYVLNSHLFNDQYLLEKAKISNYPSFFLTFKSSIRKRLLDNSYIKSVNIDKKWFGQLYIDIKEYKPLFYDKTNNVIILENNYKVDNNPDINTIPILINYVPDTIYDDFMEKMKTVNDNIKSKISEIEYKPNDVDESRFLLRMNDGNYVYLTLYKFEKINKYNDILPTLENKKGILYLDSGNYFEIFK